MEADDIDHSQSQPCRTECPREIPDSQDSPQAELHDLNEDLPKSDEFNNQADPNCQNLEKGIVEDLEGFYNKPDDAPNFLQDSPEGSTQALWFQNVVKYLESLPDNRSEIPDSQVDKQDFVTEQEPFDKLSLENNDEFECDKDLEQEHLSDTANSIATVATLIIPGGTKLTPRFNPAVPPPDAAYPLHKEGFNCNGRLAIEAPQYRNQEMDDAATQPTTQPQLDTRRLGASGHLTTQDEADIIAILHPSSPAAHVCVNLTADTSPQHIWQNNNHSHVDENDMAGFEETDMSKEKPHDAPRDIALRFSSRVNDVNMGFVFGRNIHTSDILLVRPQRKDHVEKNGSKSHAISNKHFRIFMNRHGILMLEDISTNGTIVDDLVLHGSKAPEHTVNSQPRITLHSGVMIELPTTGNGEAIRFIVNIPSRYQARSKYNENLHGYLAFLDQAARKAQALADAKDKNMNVPSNVPLLTNALPAALQQPVLPHAPAVPPVSAIPNPTTSFVAPGAHNHGLHWDGGEKYNVIGHIGSGSFATVCKLSSKRDGEVFAVKQLEKRRHLRNGLLSRKFHNELQLMMSLSHPNIIQYVDHHETPTHLFIVMEFISFGDLRHWTDKGTAMAEHTAARVGRQILDAIIYLHESGITHRDIKPDNILVAGNHPDDKIYKLTDFGLSKQVTDNSTFLQTFCGTVLYLAPEVYPGYDRVKAGGPQTSKRTRAQLADNPYEHSVDIWSLGTVLYQLLAGKPPFTATDDTPREQFLNNVLGSPVDYERLIFGGITEEAADFISRMLVIEPELRAKESELSSHPWLIPKPYPVPGSHSTEGKDGDDAEALDASQLSLADNVGDDKDTENPRDTKRLRSEDWVNDEDQNILEEGAGGLPLSCFEPQSRLNPGLTAGPSQPNRLFGEIGSSALRSSGVLGQNANLALGVSAEEGVDEDFDDGSFLDQEEPSDLASGGATHVNTPRSVTVEGQIQPTATDLPVTADTYEGNAAPSLMGTENLIEQLKMASPEPGTSPQNTNINPPTPKGTASRDFSPDTNTLKRPYQSEQAADETRKKQSSFITTSAADAVPNEKSQKKNSENKKLPEGSPSAPSTGSTKPNPTSASQAPPSPHTSILPSPNLAPSSGLTADGFAKPPARFGCLYPIKGSIKSLPRIPIRSLGTAFGRDELLCNVVHPNIHDRRISRFAFEITMWYPGLLKDLDAGKKDWAENPALAALISSRSSNGITVNGVRLKRGGPHDGWKFGTLFSGDVISVAEMPEGRPAEREADREFLRFRCEFYIGASERVRRAGEVFKVETQEVNFQKVAEKKMGEGGVGVEGEEEGEKGGEGEAVAGSSAGDTEVNTAVNAGGSSSKA